MDEIEAARAMGMKRIEVLQVVPVDDGNAVRTHDWQWTLIRDDGTTRPCEEPAVLALERDSGLTAAIEDVVDLAEMIAEDAAPKPAPKRRGAK